MDKIKELESKQSEMAMAIDKINKELAAFKASARETEFLRAQVSILEKNLAEEKRLLREEREKNKRLEIELRDLKIENDVCEDE